MFIAGTANAQYKAGDYYNENGKEGVVFWVDETGQHGKIVSLQQSEKKMKWCSDKREKTRMIGANDLENGAQNMAVVQQIPGWREMYPAFAWCADLGEGWYLPAIEELRELLGKNYILDRVNETMVEHGAPPFRYSNFAGMRHWWSSSECRGASTPAQSLAGKTSREVWCIRMVSNEVDDDGTYKDITLPKHVIAIARF